MNNNNLDSIKDFAYGLIYYVFWLIEVLLGFRFFFKLLGANPRNVFVGFFYSTTGNLVSPFVNMFKMPADPGTFEPYTIIAMLVYAILTHLVLLLIKKLMKPN